MRNVFMFIVYFAIMLIGSAVAVNGQEVQCWTQDTSTDVMTDVVKRMVYVRASDYSDKEPMLFMKCDSDNSLVIGVGHGSRIKKPNVEVRFNDKSAWSKVQWWSSPSGSLAIVPDAYIERFFNELLSNQTVTIRITDPLDGETVWGKFCISGTGMIISNFTCCPRKK